MATRYLDENGHEIFPANLARPSGQKVTTAAVAKAKVLELIAEGYQVIPAMNAVDRKEATYLDWRKTDPEFRASVDSIRSAQSEIKTTGKPVVPPFDEFCRDWLKQPLHPHQLRMWDVIEGRQPRDMHHSMDYEPGQLDRVLINVPIEHAKSTTFTVNYSVWKIHQNHDIRILILSNSKSLAKKFLYEIKQKLTHPVYRDMHMRFAPEGGWKDSDNSWSADAIYVKGKGAGGVVQKDPTVEAHGWGGSVYGQRADIIFMDDVVVTKNAGEYEKQMLLLDREVESRLPSSHEGGGLLAILGTRVAPNDLYKALRDVRDADDEQVWTYFRQPAVLDYGNGDSDTWTTLWPQKWPGKALARKKRGDAQWSLIYQQLNVGDNMTFGVEAVDASINGRRFPGVMKSNAMGHRPDGMAGLYVVGGLDPATTGNTAMIVTALDPVTQKRYVLDGFNQRDCSPLLMRQKVKYFTDVYKINEWVIERNAFQRFLTQDPELNTFLRSRGCKLTAHYTTENKFDSDFGIATMGPLFDSCGHPNPQAAQGKWIKTPDEAFIELPSQRQNAWCAELVQQLVTWEPKGMAQKAKTDLVMALWFTEIAVKRILNRKQSKTTHVNNPWLSSGQKQQRQVINLADLRRQKQEAEMMGVS